MTQSGSTKFIILLRNDYHKSIKRNDIFHEAVCEIVSYDNIIPSTTQSSVGTMPASKKLGAFPLFLQ